MPYGVDISLPEGTVEATVFQFILPASDSGGPLLAGRKQGFRPTVSVSRASIAESITLEKYVESNNRAAMQRDKGFQILKQWDQEEPATYWQDVTFLPPGGPQIYQRYAVHRPEPGFVVTTVMTSNRMDLEEIAARIDPRLTLVRNDLK